MHAQTVQTRVLRVAPIVNDLQGNHPEVLGDGAVVPLLRDVQRKLLHEVLPVNVVFKKRLAVQGDRHGVRLVHPAHDTKTSGRRERGSGDFPGNVLDSH